MELAQTAGPGNGWAREVVKRSRRRRIGLAEPAFGSWARRRGTACDGEAERTGDTRTTVTAAKHVGLTEPEAVVAKGGTKANMFAGSASHCETGTGSPSMYRSWGGIRGYRYGFESVACVLTRI